MAQTALKNITIEGISSYLPKTELDLRTLSSIYGEQETEKIISATGIERVRVASKLETSSDMCFICAQQLLKDLNYSAEEIDGIIFVSQTPDYILPETSYVLQSRLGLGTHALCRDVRLGCSGYIHGLFQAALWISCGACQKVLVLAGDTSTKLINPYDRSLRMVFGDAGTATLITTGPHTMHFAFGSDGAGANELIIPAGGFRHPKTHETSKTVIDESGNIRSAEDLFMNGMEVFRFALSCVPNAIRKTLKLIQWNKDDIDLFALHQANRFITECLRKNLRIKSELFPSLVRDTGNTGPSSIPLLLSLLYGNDLKDTQRRLNHSILCGFGVGYSWGVLATDALSVTKFFPPIDFKHS